MSNRKEVINISSSFDKIPDNIPNVLDVPNTPRPSDVPSRKRPNKWLHRYRGFWKKVKPQKVVIIDIPSSDESEEEEFEDEETEEELNEEEEEEEPEEEPMEDVNNQMELEDAIWGQDLIPSTSGDSICSRVGYELVVASPPRILQGASFEANCTWSD